jgi:hypothetical protein
VYVEPPLHPWDEADFVVVDDHPDVLLDLVCHYFIEVFTSLLLKEISLQFSFLEVSLSGFAMRVLLAS